MKRAEAKKTEKARFNHLAVEEILNRLFAADALLAEEYYRMLRRRALAPEEELMVAVLERGIADFQRFIRARSEERAPFQSSGSVAAERPKRVAFLFHELLRCAWHRARLPAQGIARLAARSASECKLARFDSAASEKKFSAQSCIANPNRTISP
jgi:hypothetical protein